MTSMLRLYADRLSDSVKNFDAKADIQGCSSFFTFSSTEPILASVALDVLPALAPAIESPSGLPSDIAAGLPVDLNCVGGTILVLPPSLAQGAWVTPFTKPIGGGLAVVTPVQGAVC